MRRNFHSYRIAVETRDYESKTWTEVRSMFGSLHTRFEVFGAHTSYVFHLAENLNVSLNLDEEKSRDECDVGWIDKTL